MKILSWNIQSGLGADGIQDLYRIIDRITNQYAPDVICLQEISRNIDVYAITGQEDQLETITSSVPSYSSSWGAAVRKHRPEGKVEEFGNLTLVKNGTKYDKVHALPQPPSKGALQIPRVAVEVYIVISDKLIRIINTHLAYHSSNERKMQLEYLNQLQQWAADAANSPPQTGTGAYNHTPVTPYTVMCGDFNFTPGSSDYQYMTDKGWLDGWLVKNDTQPATCGIFDEKTWPEGPHCRDYFWLNNSINWKISEVVSDQTCPFSDHQPIIITLDI